MFFFLFPFVSWPFDVFFVTFRFVFKNISLRFVSEKISFHFFRFSSFFVLNRQKTTFYFIFPLLAFTTLRYKNNVQVLQLLFTRRNQKRWKIIRYILFRKNHLIDFKKTVSDSMFPPILARSEEKMNFTIKKKLFHTHLGWQSVKQNI
jgi:hypothetical protein